MEYQYSVIIPVYNAEKTIQRCLDSLVRQNNGYAQIILINDGSCDNSGAICEEYAAKHACITYVYQKNAGASSARNTGLSVASGKYITFVDSDDYVLDHYFETLSASDADLCVFSYNILNSGIFSSHDVSNLLSFESDYTEFVLEIMRSRAIGPTNKRYLRSIIENKHIRFKKDLVIGEDFIFLLEYMLACKTFH